MSKKFYNNGVVCRLFEENFQPENWVLGKLKYTDLSSLDFNAVVLYFKNHTIDETCIAFNINTHQLAIICKTLNYKKSQKEIIELRNKNNLIKYEVENVFQLQSVISTIKDTKIKNYRSLEASYALRNQKTIKTLQAKTNNKNITNVFQLPETKEKIAKSLAEHFGNGDLQAAKSYCAKKGNDTKEKLYGYRGVQQTPEVEHKKRKKYLYDDAKFDSSWELALWIYAKDHNEDIIRGQGVQSFTYEFNGKIHQYHPDFLYKNELIEIKSSYQYSDGKLYCRYGNSKRTLEEINIMNEMYKAKLQCMLDNNVKIWTEEDCKFAIDYCIIKYNCKNWYLQFKTWGKN